LYCQKKSFTVGRHFLRPLSAQDLREENPFELVQRQKAAAALAEEERALQSSDDEVRHFVVLHGARYFAGFDGRFQAIADATLNFLEYLGVALAQRFALVARLGGEVATQAAVLATVLTEETPVRVDIRADPAERGERLVAQRFAHHLAAPGIIKVQRLQREHLLGGEVVSERSLGNACGAHDVPHTGPIVTLPVHDLHALAQDHVSMGLLSHASIWTVVFHVSNPTTVAAPGPSLPLASECRLQLNRRPFEGLVAN
jgi:hypothetical protein